MIEKKFDSIYCEVFRTSNFGYALQKIARQKLMYFLDYLGVAEKSLNYSWDNFGPYTTDLDLHNEELEGEIKFTDKENKVINTVKNTLDELATEPAERVNAIELLASIHYLYHVKFIRDKKRLLEVLFSRKQKEKFSKINEDKAYTLAISLC